MSNLTPTNERNVDSSQWLPAQCLGQFRVDESVRPWLIGKGLLTLRMKAACGERFGLRLVEQWTGLLCAARKAALGVGDGAGIVPRRRAVLRRSRLGVCAIGHSRFHLVSASVAR